MGDIRNGPKFGQIYNDERLCLASELLYREGETALQFNPSQSIIYLTQAQGP